MAADEPTVEQEVEAAWRVIARTGLLLRQGRGSRRSTSSR